MATQADKEGSCPPPCPPASLDHASPGAPERRWPWPPPPSPGSSWLALRSPLKVTPFRAAGPALSGVIFFIKKQNLNQENKVIKFLLGTAGPTTRGNARLAGRSDPRPSTAGQENRPITDTNRKQLVFPKHEGWAGVPRARAVETARHSAGWAARVLEEPVRQDPWARAWPEETGVCPRKLGSWHAAHSLLGGFGRPAWAAVPRLRACELKQGLLVGAGEGWAGRGRMLGRSRAGPSQARRDPGSVEPAGVHEADRSRESTNLPGLHEQIQLWARKTCTSAVRGHGIPAGSELSRRAPSSSAAGENVATGQGGLQRGLGSDVCSAGSRQARPRPQGPLSALRRGQVGAQEDSLVQGLAGSSQLWAAVSSLSMGEHKERFTHRDLSPTAPLKAPRRHALGSPVVGTARWTVGLDAPGSALSAQHAAGAQKGRPGRFCGAPGGDCGTDALAAGPSLGTEAGALRTSAALQLQSSPGGRSETPRLGGKACRCLGARVSPSRPRRSQGSGLIWALLWRKHLPMAPGGPEPAAGFGISGPAKSRDSS